MTTVRVDVKRWNTLYFARLEEESELVESIDFEESLLDCQRIRVRKGLANARAIVRERGEAVVVDGHVDVGIIVVMVRKVPIGTIEANAVGENLQGGRGAAVGFAVCRGDGELLRDRGVLQDE